ncbi:MAG: preprotein translocase subunit SecY, partial [Candidatus Latescibacteria bacterium]|nr:preprotein translocase subunit SecY [Candidatus Latescibacterota bacterium]
AVMPAMVIRFSDAAFGMSVSTDFSQFFGGTGMLIVVGVALDTLQQVESHLLMRHYDGFLKKGKLRGRR